MALNTVEQTGHQAAGNAAARPLTEAQAGMWFAQRLDPGNSIFNTAQRTDIEGALDIDAFTWAVNTAMAECDSLALRVIEIEGVPASVIDPAHRPRLRRRDFRAEVDPQAVALAWMQHERQQPVDPTRDPLAAQWLITLGPNQFVWYQRVHHLAIDGYGMTLIDARVAQLYRCRVHGAPTGVVFGALALAQDEDAAYRRSDKCAVDAAYWHAVLAQAPPVVGLTEGVPVSAHHFLAARVTLSDAFSAALTALNAVCDVSWPDILMGLSAAYVARMTACGHAVVGAPYMGRLGSASARVPAMVMNVLAAVIKVDEQIAVTDFLVTTARSLSQARRHGRYRGEQLRRDLGRLGAQRRLFGPLVNVLPFVAPVDLGGLRTATTVLCAGPVDDLTLTYRADAVGQGMQLIVEANPALYCQAEVDAHATRLACFLHRALCARRLVDVPTLTESEWAQWRRHAQGPAHDVPRTSLAALMAQTFVTRAQACALQFEDQSISYGELDVRTRVLAQALQTRGVGPGSIVALGMPRGIELVVALVAILRAGAAYLPLDLTHPPARLTTILKAARPRSVLSLQSARSLIPAESVWCIDIPDVPDSQTAASHDGMGFGGARFIAAQGNTELAKAVLDCAGPDDPAYLIYTSGSTGAPKGVLVQHDAIVNRLLWMQAHYGFGVDSRCLQKTPATFDVSVWEFFLPLICGGVLVIAPPEAHKDPAWLAEIIRRQRVDTLHFVPSMLSAFLAEPTVRHLPVVRVFCSGEALPAALRDRFHQTLNADLHNLYGPTEAAVDVTYWAAGSQDKSAPVPIGFPVWNTALYVLDHHLRPMPIGVPGHLYIAGRQLARGYLGREDLTRERFVTDPYGEQGTRMYATGDLARRRSDGALVFLGRSDQQIKIRGLRIELAEIEAVLMHAPGAAQIAVLVHADAPGLERIVAYAVAHQDAQLTHAGLRPYAAQRLPDYMVPTAFVILPALPVTVNGKLDRQALPAPPRGGSSGRAPTTATEQIVAVLFAQVLQRAAPVSNADDDFFELGADSLLAAQLASAIRQRWGYAFSLGAIFAHPTVARLARHLDALASLAADDPSQIQAGGGFGPLIVLREGSAKRPALFCVHPAGGLSWCYGALARALAPARPVYGIQALGLHPGAPPAASIATMAAGYVDEILRLQSRGPYHLAGWSVGGILAQAMAVELRKRDLEVGVLVMLDAYPSDCWRDQPTPPPQALYTALLHIAGYDPAALPGLSMTRDGVIDFLRRSGHPLGELPDDMINGVFHVVAENNALVRAHNHDIYDGEMLYFRAALDHQGENLLPQQWLPYVTSLDIHPIPSMHAHMVGAEAAQRIAAVVSAHLVGFDDQQGDRLAPMTKK